MLSEEASIDIFCVVIELVHVVVLCSSFLPAFNLEILLSKWACIALISIFVGSVSKLVNKYFSFRYNKYEWSKIRDDKKKPWIPGLVENDGGPSPQAGKQNGLKIIMDLNVAQNSIATVPNNFHGVQVSVAPRHEFPVMNMNSFLIAPGRS